MNKQNKLFEMGMLPVFKTIPGHEKWARIYLKPIWQVCVLQIIEIYYKYRSISIFAWFKLDCWSKLHDVIYTSHTGQKRLGYVFRFLFSLLLWRVPIYVEEIRRAVWLLSTCAFFWYKMVFFVGFFLTFLYTNKV